ncbi:hypothetical protein RsY01_889 [Lactococcus reticulitermitis]|uniref:Uncharacterized protein n=1 Tax=Pseudolactococcus reticulitermitis TaxID=2025039 RepID=A0A224X764_9LACT|nr:hypothetical protein RsY01_889 [Lactococcus reticulitermitis]
MSYIIGYNATKLKTKWYISNFENPMQGLTRYKSKAFRLDTSERASAMVKHLKIVRPYDWAIEEIRK